MIAAKKRIPAPSLKIAVIKNDIPVKAVILYPVMPEEKKVSTKINMPDPQTRVSFDQCIMPVQPEGYIKCRENDFL